MKNICNGKERLYDIHGFCSSEAKSVPLNVAVSNIRSIGARVNGKLPSPEVFKASLWDDCLFKCSELSINDKVAYPNAVLFDVNKFNREIEVRKKEGERNIFVWILILKIVRFQYTYYARFSKSEMFKFGTFDPLDEYEAELKSDTLFPEFLLKEIKKERMEEVAKKLNASAKSGRWSGLELCRAIDAEVVAARAARIIFESWKAKRKGVCWDINTILAILQEKATQSSIFKKYLGMAIASFLLGKAKEPNICE